MLSATDAVKAGLGAALLRLQEQRQRQHQAESVADQRFQAWQLKWSGQESQIKMRLMMIDSELERWSPRATRPQLSILQDGSEGRVGSMGPF